MVKSEWKEDKLGNYITQISKKNKNLEVTNVVSVTKYDGIVNSLEYFDKQVFSKDLSNYKVISRNQFAYSTIHLNEGSIGYLDIADQAILSPMYTVFEIDENKIDKKFLIELLKSNKYINLYNRIGEGSIDRRSSISYSKFSEIKVLVPPLKEQQKIAEILSTVDSQIDDTDKLIEKTKELKKGLMQRLLTKGIGHSEFKKSEVGEIPAEWEVKNIGNICGLINGRAFKPEEWMESGIPIIRIQNLNGSDEYNYYDGEIDNKYMIKKGDLLFSWSGSRGTSFGPHIWSKIEGVLNQHIFRVDLKDGLDKKFIYYNLKNITMRIEQEAHGSAGLVHITKGALEKINICLPKIKEQKQIGDILSSVDNQISEYENKKAKLEELKKGLMQKLLTGEIRVV